MLSFATREVVVHFRYIDFFYLFFFVIDKVARAHDINPTDVGSKPSKSREKKTCAQEERKSLADTVKVPTKIRNLNRWTRTNAQLSDYPYVLQIHCLGFTMDQTQERPWAIGS